MTYDSWKTRSPDDEEYRGLPYGPDESEPDEEEEPMSEHPIDQPIRMIQVPCDKHGNPKEYIVGRNGVTRIEPTVKSGMHADIAYIRVWGDGKAIAEFCQHSLSGVYFE